MLFSSWWGSATIWLTCLFFFLISGFGCGDDLVRVGRTLVLMNGVGSEREKKIVKMELNTKPAAWKSKDVDNTQRADRVKRGVILVFAEFFTLWFGSGSEPIVNSISYGRRHSQTRFWAGASLTSTQVTLSCRPSLLPDYSCPRTPSMAAPSLLSGHTHTDTVPLTLVPLQMN